MQCESLFILDHVDSCEQVVEIGGSGVTLELIAYLLSLLVSGEDGFKWEVGFHIVSSPCIC